MTDLTHFSLRQTGITDPDRPDEFLTPDPVPDPFESDRTSRAIANPPGQTSLTYRVGDYGSFLQSMLLRLHSQTVSWTDINDQQQTQRPLRHLNITRHPNWIVALLQAWAVVGDVLTFYQERIANEGYLATATEHLSVRELLRSIGYELHPGVAATTYLAFTLLDAATAPDRVMIPAGTAVQSLPPSTTGATAANFQAAPTLAQLPVTFETIQPIQARVAWNTLPSYLPTRHPSIRQDSTRLLLQGVKTGIRPGDGLLLLMPAGTTPAWSCQVVQTVTPNLAQGWTQVSWQGNESDAPANSAVMPTPQVLTFAKQAALFGKDIPKWDTLSDQAKQRYGGIPQGGVMYSADGGQTFQSVHQSLIGKTIRGLTINGKGQFFAATDAGVLRSLDQGQTWQPINTGLTRKDVYALTQTSSDDLVAGSSDGGVFRLRLGSDRWEPVRPVSQASVSQPGSQPVAPAPSSPSILLYSLAAGVDPKTRQNVYFMGTERGVWRSLDDGNTWKAIGIGLPGWNKATATAALTVYTIALQATTSTVLIGSDRGIFLSKNWGNTWKAANHGLTIAPPPAIDPGQPDLTQIQTDLEQVQTDLQEVREQVQDASARLRPLLDRLRQATQAIGTVIPSPILAVLGNVTGIVTGLADQVRSMLPALAVSPTTTTPGIPTHALLIANSSATTALILAGTDRGIFRSLDGGNTWQAVPQSSASASLSGVAVRSLIMAPVTPAPMKILGGTDQGIFQSTDQGATWTLLGSPAAVSALAISATGQLLALTPFSGLREPPPQLHLSEHQLDLDRVYPNLARDRWLMVQQTSPAFPDPSAPSANRLVACRITQVTTTTRQMRSRTVPVSRLTIDPELTDTALLEALNPRQTIVHIQSEAIALFAAATALPVRGRHLRLAGIDLDLQPGQALSLVGKHPTIRLVTERALTLTSLDGLEAMLLQPQKLFDLDLRLEQELQQGRIPAELQSRFQDNQIPLSPQVSLRSLAGDRWLLQDRAASGEAGGYLLVKGDRQLTVYETVALQVRSPALPAPHHPHQRIWQVTTAAGFEGTVLLTTADYLWESAPSTSETIGEMVQILGSKIFVAKHYTLVQISHPLRYLYDPLTVNLCGNVALATQGETVQKEVLGTGDASQSNQKFVLKKPPLTYVPATTPDGTQSTLEVRVRGGLAWGPVQTMGTLTPRRQESGVLWSEVPSLANSTPQDHHYTVRVNHAGKTTIQFGDGKQGARLPGGLENVEATYRSGMGSGGNLDRDRLVLLKSRPAGIRKVTNPLPAAGGTDPESLEAAKLNAPGSLRALQRIISLSDYEDFAKSFAGVGKALVQRLWNGRSHVIHLTVAATDGSPADPVALLNPLQQAITQYQAAFQPVQLDSYLPCFFNLSVQVLIQADLELDPMQAAIAQYLTQTFSFAQRQFGQPVAASEVITAIQVVPGVVAVELLTLHRFDTPPSLNPLLSAASPHWDSNQQAIAPAELLQINPRTGIHLSLTRTL